MANQYIFLPWLRRGLAKQIAEPDPLTGAAIPDARPKIKINVRILADEVEKKTMTQEIVLLGPGDITGIDAAAIVKTDPAPGVNNFEPNFFPYIEFYEEDFPWRYSPATAASGERRLRPWMTLIVLEETEFDRKQNSGTRGSRSIRLNADAVHAGLPVNEQSWAWAHVQVNNNDLHKQDLAASNDRNQQLAQFLNNNPNLGVSRLMCARRLKPTTKYYAFVVPSFERGRLAGLGAKKEEIESAGRFKPCWDAESNSSLELPYYYEWSFQTGTEDFEALAKKIIPRDLTGTEVGKLWMDAADINYGNAFGYKGNLASDDETRNGFLPFLGALRLPGPPALPLNQQTGGPEKEFVKALAGLVNLGVQYRNTLKSDLPWAVVISGNDQDDPLLVPPVYGRWYAKVDGDAVVDPSLINDWLEQLNLDPAFRVAAGLGSEVVREYQEEYVSRAWEQLAENRKNLNQELQRLRFAQEITNAAYKKHFIQGNNSQEEQTSKILGLTQSLHGIVKSGEANLTVAGKLDGYKANAAFVQPAYRRITRSNGPLMKRANVTGSSPKKALLFGMADISVLAFAIFSNPPFQNFNCSTKLINANFVSILTQSIILQNPNWFGDNPGNMPVKRTIFFAAIKDLQEIVLKKPILRSVAQVDLSLLGEKIQAKIIPAFSFSIRYQALLPLASTPAVSNSEEISPNSFNPFYTDSTYERLSKLYPGLFIPNLEQVKPESFVLLQANSAFIESFLVGMNHELAAEFLWRGFPADMNATFFRQFWDKADSAQTLPDHSDIDYIRKWKINNALGLNGPPGTFPDPLVFVIKAELVRKYPNLVVYAQKAKYINNNKNRVPDTSVPATTPVFLANLSPDFLFAGFNLSKKDVLGDNAQNDGGYYFVIAERPGEVHFGLDQSRVSPAPVALMKWDDLAWTDISSVTGYIDLQRDIPVNAGDHAGLEWGKGQEPVTADPVAGSGDAAQMAAILRQKPVQIFVHSSMLVT